MHSGSFGGPGGCVEGRGLPGQAPPHPPGCGLQLPACRSRSPPASSGLGAARLGWARRCRWPRRGRWRASPRVCVCKPRVCVCEPRVRVSAAPRLPCPTHGVLRVPRIPRAVRALRRGCGELGCEGGNNELIADRERSPPLSPPVSEAELHSQSS